MLILLLTAALVLPQGADQFDLVCAGTSTSSGDYLAPETVPSNTRIRVDLQRGIWCTNDCAFHSEFVRVSATELVMEDSKQPTLEMERSVDRTNGHYMVRVQTDIAGIRGTTYSSAYCERAPYTPIPAAKF